MNRRVLLPSIGDLVAFESAARHASFTRAAAELNLTQSAISRAVRLLEERIGVTLFERVRQRVVLTAAGTVYLQDVRRILDELRESTHRVMAFADSAATLNIAVLPTFATRWLVPRLPDFARQHPDITLNFATRLQPFNFAAEPFDAAIHYGNPTWAAAESYHLMDEVMVAVCSPEYRRAQDIRSPADVPRISLLHQTTRPMAWADWFEEAGIEAAGVHRGPRYEQFSMIAQAAVSGLGAALLPKVLIEDELAANRLEVLFDQQLKSPSAYYWVVPDEKVATTPLKAFTRWITGKAKEAAAA
jgi:LysR family glycine cleavage system transcriptional activator